ncbi:MAG TPA: glycosyltransferase family 4 protein [Solirubrobacteraceae bacterium]
MISNLYPPVAVGGYETRCAHTAQWLARRHEIVVLTSSLRRRGLKGEPDVYRDLPFVPEKRLGVLLAPLASARAVRVVKRALRRHEPDLVFVWNASNIPRAGVRVAQGSKIPVAFSLADPWLGSFTKGDLFLRYLAGEARGWRGAWSWLMRLTNRLPWLRIELEEAFPASLVWNSQALRNLTPIPSGVRPALERVIHPTTAHERLFAAVRRSPAPMPTIAFVGRLEPEKAPDLAIRALALLRESHGLDVRLLLMGTGEPTVVSQLEDLVRALRLEDRVELRGAVPIESVASALGEAHAIVVPSRWQEPFGLVCLEAALARVPVVASMSGGMPEMLEPGEEALFFAIDDVDACAAALADTLTDKSAAAERVRRARARADDYSLERYREAYDAFVEDALLAGREALAASINSRARVG